MNLEIQNILYFSRSTQHGGTENVILQLCEIFHPLVNKIIVVSADGFNVEKLKSFGIKHYVIPDIEKKSLTTMYKVSKIIKKIVKDEYVTVIHTHHRMAAFYVRLLGLNRKAIFINTSHNTFTNRRELTRFSYKKAKLIACGEMVKKNLAEVFGFEEVAIIHNSVKSFEGKILADKQLKKAKDAGKILIGNIGRLTEQKGMEYFIQAVPVIVDAHPETCFFIIGSGEDEEKLKKMSEGLPIKFLGYRTDIQNLMSQLDIIVLSSLWEGLPLTPLEAFSVGKTVVATAVDGTLEIVRDGENGLLAKPKSVGGLAYKILWMIEHPAEKRKMEVEAKIIFDNEFSFDKFAQSYVNYYRSL